MPSPAFIPDDGSKGRPRSERPLVCVQGLGFVGAAMAVAVASARDGSGAPHFDVVGVDLPTEEGRGKIRAINEGRLPMRTTDERLEEALRSARGNLRASDDPSVYRQAHVVVVDVDLGLSLGTEAAPPRLEMSSFEKAIRTLGEHLSPGALVVIESTVPPGTSERVVVPTLDAWAERRGLPKGSFLVAHAYERVMPGVQYLDSIVNFWRVYSGTTVAAADACEAFLRKVINVAVFPLTRLSSTTASETAKVLENSYRAVNIAFMEEWGRFAEEVGIDMFEIVDAIRPRPTHSNIRQPGFGVGGYCLTKDPAFASVAARELLRRPDLRFPFSLQALEFNRRMPLVALERLGGFLGGLSGRTLLLLGISYRHDVADTRFSPAEPFVREAEARGAKVIGHDPLLDYWPELQRSLPRDIPSAEGIDAVVLAVPHREYVELNFERWLEGQRPLIFDANHVLTRAQRVALRAAGCEVVGVGFGAGL